MPKDEKDDYKNCRIVDIRRNKRTGNIHARLESEKGELLISATLEYIMDALYERIPINNSDEKNNPN
jgi:hypothetical protein